MSSRANGQTRQGKLVTEEQATQAMAKVIAKFHDEVIGPKVALHQRTAGRVQADLEAFREEYRIRAEDYEEAVKVIRESLDRHMNEAFLQLEKRVDGHSREFMEVLDLEGKLAARVDALETRLDRPWWRFWR